MHHILDMTPPELTDALKEMGQPAYRARQVMEWVWQKDTYDFASMTSLPSGLRAVLADRFTLLAGRVVDRRRTNDDVVKLLLEWPDGCRVETVAIPAVSRDSGKARCTACVSTQVGCPIGCAFCASGLGGVERNLSAGEIVEQVIALQSDVGQRITHVVVMGMGEPLANYDATVRAVRTLVDPQRGGLSARHITVSTVGLPDAIERLGGEDLPINLAISLHAANDALRRRLIPTAGRTPLERVIQAGRTWFARTGREITLEYVLLAGVNDSPRCAEELAQVAGSLRCNVNLIRYNPVEGLPYRAPSEANVLGFRDLLAAAGVNVQIRASRGRDVDAACGQLRRRTTAPQDGA